MKLKLVQLLSLLLLSAYVSGMQQEQTLSFKNHCAETLVFIRDSKYKHIINLKWTNGSLTKVSKDDFKQLPDLKTIDLSNNQIDTIDFNAFDSLKNLEFVELGGNQLGIDTITVLRNKLGEKLKLTEPTITADQLKLIALNHNAQNPGHGEIPNIIK